MFRFKVRNVCLLIRLFNEWLLCCDCAPGPALALGIQTLSQPREVPWRPQGQADHVGGGGGAANQQPEPPSALGSQSSAPPLGSQVKGGQLGVLHKKLGTWM